MSQNVTVKVVSQRVSLEYHGVGTKSSLVAASRMRALLNMNAKESKEIQQTPAIKSSLSFTLFESKPSKEIANSLNLCFEPVLTKLKCFEEPVAVQKRADFFRSVESGKKSLVEKFGKRIPNEEIMKLASSLKGKSVTIWKHQVITTLTSDTEFSGSRRTREGKFTSSVKSKTVYTLQPLTGAQLEELKALLVAEKDSTTGRTASRVSRGGYSFWETKVSGSIIFKELKQSSVLETNSYNYQPLG